MEVKVNIYGVRGSAPISHKDYIKYGGNTASYTIRTPENSLLFLDAGTGIKLAENELNHIAKKVALLISHTHADHIIGFGMSKLSKLNQQEGYEDSKLQIIGPNDIQNSLSKFYDGDVIWPVKFGQSTNRNRFMSGIDYENIIEYEEDNQDIQIDSKTKITLMQGNHPVKDGVILYKVEIERSEGNLKIIYATDNEFDYLIDAQINPKKDELKQRYVDFIQSADLLIAEAQYTKENYESMGGYGHSYPEQIIELADQANVKRILITHHNLTPDAELEESYHKAVEFAHNLNPKLVVDFAIEGTEIIF